MGQLEQAVMEGRAAVYVARRRTDQLLSESGEHGSAAAAIVSGIRELVAELRLLELEARAHDARDRQDRRRPRHGGTPTSQGGHR